MIKALKGIIRGYFSIGLASRVLIWMALGALAGIFLGPRVLFLKPVGELFLNLLILAAIPLVFFNLLFGISSLGNVRALGRIGGKVMLWYLCSVLIAIIIGIGVMSVSKAGEGMALQGEVSGNIGAMPSLGDVFVSMVPTNIFRSFAEGNLIQIVVFAVLLSVVTLNMPVQQKNSLVKAYGLITSLLRSLVELILKISPLGLGALMAVTFAEFGAGIIGSLGRFIMSVYSGHVLMVIVYMAALKFVGGISPKWFFKTTRQLYATTAATCSSLASLAVSLDIAKTKMKLPEKIYSFSLPMGAQFNKDGTAIMLSGILIFTAQAAGLEFGYADLFRIVVVGLLVVEGSSGIPGGGLVTAMLFARAFNLPVEIVAIVGGIYRLIDMGNTTVNCMGDMVVTSIVSKSETDWKPGQ